MKKLFFLTLFVSSSFYLKAQQNWSSFGNSGLDLTTEFLGTTDNVPLLLRVNSIQSVKVASNGFLSLGYQANRVNSNATNTAIGHQAFYNITGAGVDGRTALGYQAGYSTTTGWKWKL